MPKMIQTEYGEWHVPYRHNDLKRFTQQHWFPYFGFFVGLAIFAVGAAITEKVTKRQDLIQSRQELLQVLPVLGKRESLVKVIEFTDYACNLCSEEHFKLQERLKPFIQRGEVALFTYNVQRLGDAGIIGTRYEYCVAQHDPKNLQAFMDGVFRNNSGLLGFQDFQNAYQATGGQKASQMANCQGSPEAVQYQQSLKLYIDKLKVQQILVGYTSLAVQDHMITDTRNLEQWITETVQNQGKLSAAFKQEAQRLY